VGAAVVGAAVVGAAVEGVAVVGAAVVWRWVVVGAAVVWRWVVVGAAVVWRWVVVWRGNVVRTCDEGAAVVEGGDESKCKSTTLEGPRASESRRFSAKFQVICSNSCKHRDSCHQNSVSDA
jgi:hypothetical protein